MFRVRYWSVCGAMLGKLALLGGATLLLAGCGKPGALSPEWSLAGSRVGVGPQVAAPVSKQDAPTQSDVWRAPAREAKSPTQPSSGAVPASPTAPDRLIVPPRPIQVSRHQQPIEPTAKAPQKPTAAASAPEPPAAKPKPRTNGGRAVVTVAAGETLVTIAAAHKVSVAELMFVNSLRSLDVQPGQSLTIPARKGARGA